jgi:hypothetical protein
MPYTIEYGPKGDRQTVTGLKLAQIAPQADELIAAGEQDVRILNPRGEPVDLAQFKLDVQGMRLADAART